MFEKHPAAIQFGVPRGKPSMASLEAMVLFALFIIVKPHAGNTAKALEAGLRLYPLCFQALIGFSTGQIFEFFRPAARPIDDHAVNLLMNAHSECNR